MCVCVIDLTYNRKQLLNLKQVFYMVYCPVVCCLENNAQIKLRDPSSMLCVSGEITTL